MNDWVLWLVMAGVLVVFELFTGTFYVLMIAIGMGVGALAALMGMTVPVQTLIAAAVGVAATLVLHRSRFGKPFRGNSARDPNVNIDIGQRLTVGEWQGGKARVMYRGALWDVELGQGAIPESGSFKIVEVQGSRLIVANT